MLRDNGLSISPMSPLGHHSSSAAPQDSEMKPAKAKKEQETLPKYGSIKPSLSSQLPKGHD